MLPRKRRIPKEEFAYIIQSGKRFNSPHFLLTLTPLSSKPLGESRFSFSVSKKVAKTAIERNRQRRRGYTAVRKLLETIKPGYFLLFSFKSGSSSLREDLIFKEIKELLLAAHMIL